MHDIGDLLVRAGFLPEGIEVYGVGPLADRAPALQEAVSAVEWAIEITPAGVDASIGVDPAAVRVIPPGADPDDFPPMTTTDARGRLGKEDAPYTQGPRLALLLKAAQSVDSAAISRQAMHEGLKGPDVGARLDAARVAAIALAL